MSGLSRVYLSLGSNLGSRQSNILQALQYVQTQNIHQKSVVFL